MEDVLQPLLGLTDGLGIARQDLVEGETANRVFVETEVLCSAAKKLTFEHIESAIKSWDGALLLRITSPYGIRELNVSASSSFDQSAFAEFCDDVARAGNDDTIKVRLSVDKSLMVQKKIAAQSGTNVLAYLFLSNLTRVLSGEHLGELGPLLFSPQAHCCCVVLDAPDFVLEGPYLSVWGRVLFDVRYAAVRIARNDRLQTARELRADQTSWLGFDTSLTPYEFLVTDCSDCRAGIYLSVLRLQYLLVILYLADGVRYSNDGFVATFNSQKIFATARSNYAALVGGFVAKYFEKLKEVTLVQISF